VKIRIALPTPNHSGVSQETRQSIDTLLKSGIADFEVYEVQSTYPAQGRNAAIDEKESHDIHPALGDWEYILTVDADMKFTPENVAKLIAINNDIVSTSYIRRDHPEQIVAGYWSDESGPEFLTPKATGLMAIDFVGNGLCLIRRSVFETLEFPWFENITIRRGNKATEVGEDVYFCKKAKAAGLNIFVDCDNRVEHLVNWTPAPAPTPRFQPMKNGKPVSKDVFISEVLSDACEINAKILALAQLVKSII
jgi:hypothetical protein